MDRPAPSLLVVDDEDYTRNFLRKLFQGKGYDIHVAADGYTAIDIFKGSAIDLVLLDQRMPGISGIEVLKTLKEMDNDLTVIMMTGYGTIEQAVKAMKLGAYYYLTKPFNNIEEVELTVERALKEKSLRDENRYLKARLNDVLSFDGIVGKSKVMTQIIELVKKIAPLDSTIILSGETGTGKELIAKTIHRNSLRVNNKFVAVNCGALAEGLLESSIFGFEKGAFTGATKTTSGYFEEADGGTLFLDEITNTSLKFQISLLRVIQEKEFSRLGETVKRKTDFRLIAATNCDLKKEVEEGRFREDLYYRINVIPIHLPSLNERKEDIALLSNFFLEKFNRKLGKDVGPFGIDVMDVFEGYEWNGNVRELENTMERIVALKEGGMIRMSDLPPHLLKWQPSSEKESGYTHLPFQEAKDAFERMYIEDTLQRTGGNITMASEITGIKRQNLYVKLKKYGLR